MSTLLGNSIKRSRFWSVLIVLGALLLAAIFGLNASRTLLLLLLAGLAALLLLQRPVLGLLLLIFVSLVADLDIGTGTAVSVNTVILMIPVVTAIWLLDLARQRSIKLRDSRTYLPLFLLLVVGTASLLIGNATWDPLVPRPSNFLLVQLAQLAIFYFAATAYLLAGNLIKDEGWLRYLTWTFLGIGGVLAFLYVLPATRSAVGQLATEAITRAPFWTLLAAMAGGQLLFNRSLALWKQLLLGAVLAAVGYYAFFLQRDVVSVWIGIVAAGGMLFWLRFPRLRWLVVVGVMALLVAGVLFPALYQFAGGDAEWQLSGVSRIDLGRRVIEVTSRNPITGLGPASYRVYASAEPLAWRGGTGIWIGAVVSSHNNYIDIFSFFGIVGLLIFFWFMGAIALQGVRLRKRFRSGFASGYVNGVLATWAGAMVLMLFADWLLPFVYNIGFPGFQASVLVWIFFGGMVVLEAMGDKPEGRADSGKKA